MAPTTPNEIFGRPVLLDMMAGADAANYIAAETILRASPLMQLLTWNQHDSLTTTYKRRAVARVGQLRAINTDYAPKFAGGESTVTTELAILGDAYEWDRILGAVNPAEVEAQAAAMAPGIANRFADLMINGNRGTSALEFNGLSAIADAVGGDAVQSGLDLSIGAGGDTLAFRRNLARLTRAIRQMVALGLRPVVIGNTDVQAAVDLAADLVPASRTVADYFNTRTVNVIAGAALLDAGMANVYGTPTTDALGRTVYPVTQEEIIPSDTTTGVVTDIYVIGVGTEGLSGATLRGFDARSPVRFETARTDAGAIRRIEMEIAAGLEVRDERAVVKFADVKVG